MDRFLAMALLLALTFSVNGIGWGRVEDWNRSSMALRGLGRHGMPGDYLKPPLHTFVTHIVVKAPIDRIEKAASFVLRKRQNFGAARLVAVCREILLKEFLRIDLPIDEIRDVENNIAPLEIEHAFTRLTNFGERFHRVVKCRG